MKKMVFTLCALALASFATEVQMHSSLSCGCCGFWAKYMQDKGYKVSVNKSNDFYKIKEEKGIKAEFQSCHTAMIEGYAVEGHVPEDAIAWLLANKPQGVIGLAVTGMPIGSPGMEQGGEEIYPVLLLYKDGTSKLYSNYKGHKKLD